MRHFKALSVQIAALALLCAEPAFADHDEGRAENRRDRDATRTHIAFDMDFGNAIDEPGTSSGGGGAVRIGQELDLFLVSLTPELGGGYHAFVGSSNARVYSGFLGGRLAVGKIVEPSIFGHLGVARLEGTEARTAPMLDAGLALDLTVLPLIDLGAHGSYNAMFPRDDGSAFKWMVLGAHAALVL
jgi:hypothetical protein